MLVLFRGNTRIGCFIKPAIAFTVLALGYSIYRYGFERTNTVIGILTPFVLLIWFFYSQRQTLHDQFNNELKGVYADVLLERAFLANNEVREAVILNISQVNLQGEFVGGLTYIRTELGDPKNPSPPKVQKHPYVIYGRIRYEVMLNTTDDVRKYGGEFSVTARPYRQSVNEAPDQQNIIHGRYQIVFNRELQSIRLHEARESTYEPASNLNLPNVFFLYKQLGLSNEPYELVKKHVLFHNDENMSTDFY